MIKQLFATLALAGSLFVSKSSAISLDDIQIWTGSGTNRAALVIEWSTPENLTYTSVPATMADKTLVWGFRFNGTANASQMLNAILAADPRLYAVEAYGGDFTEALGYNLNASGIQGITDGLNTYYFTNGVIWDPYGILDVDDCYPVNGGDLYWGGSSGPNWEVWTELGDDGGFENSPNRGSNEFWTTTDPVNFYTGNHGQWELAGAGLGELLLTNGSWIGYSVASGGDNYLDNNDPSTIAYNTHKHAPPSPDGTYTAYVCNTNDFAVQVISTNNLDAASPYNDPTAVLGRPTLQFYDPYDYGVTDRVSIVDEPFNVTPAGNPVITGIETGGQITVQLGRKIYANPNHPYGMDFIVYGNSFFYSFLGNPGTISDATDFNALIFNNATFSNGLYGHPTTVSVSQDGVNWYTCGTAPELFPDNAYRWDNTNDAWTEEEMNPTKPLNPSVLTAGFSGQSVAGGLDQFVGAAGGTAFSLQGSGLTWIQYVRVQPPVGASTFVDAIAAVDSVVVGDALSITPENITVGITNLDFQNPANPGQNLIALSFNSVSTNGRVSTAALSEFSAYAPVSGAVSSAYKIKVQSVSGPGPVTYQASAALRAGSGYAGNGGDLRVYQWNWPNWISRPCTFNPTNQEVFVTGLTNFSTLVVSQIIPPQLVIQNLTNSYAFQFAPVPNGTHLLQRSTDLIHWTTVTTLTPSTPQPVTLQDDAPPAGQAFYRLSISVP